MHESNTSVVPCKVGRTRGYVARAKYNTVKLQRAVFQIVLRTRCHADKTVLE